MMNRDELLAELARYELYYDEIPMRGTLPAWIVLN